MITLQAPLWLILLGLIPLIRWLHRFRQNTITHPSTTLFLWRAFKQASDNDGVLTRPDPRWLLRALIATLVILALSEPTLQNQRGPVFEIWLDDSLSMFAREDGRQRIQTGVEKLQLYLADRNPSRILIHSLGNPATLLELDIDNTSGWRDAVADRTSAPGGEPSPPPPATLSPGSNHVLLTDGADSALNRWALSAPLHHVIQVGSTRQNTALTRLSLRDSLNAPGKAADKLNGIARIDNPGDTPQQVRLVLQMDDRIIETQRLDVPASGNTITAFTIPSATHDTLQARIESSHDALSLDDRLELDLEQIRPPLNYQSLGSCDPYVTAALDAHPTLVRAVNRPDVIIDCSDQVHDYTRPALKLHPPRSVQYTTQSAHWHDQQALGSLRLAAGLPYSSAAPAITSEVIPVLSADGRVLILKHKGDGQMFLHSFLDTSDPAFARQPEYPLLILGLVDQLTAWRMDNIPLTTSRESEASRVSPTALSISPTTTGEIRSTRTSLVYALLIAALLLLALDAVLDYRPVKPASGFRTLHR